MGKFKESKNRVIELHIDKKSCNNCQSSLYCEEKTNFEENNKSACDDWELSFHYFEHACEKLTEQDEIDIIHPYSDFIVIEDDVK